MKFKEVLTLQCNQMLGNERSKKPRRNFSTWLHTGTNTKDTSIKYTWKTNWLTVHMYKVYTCSRYTLTRIFIRYTSFSSILQLTRHYSTCTHTVLCTSFISIIEATDTQPFKCIFLRYFSFPVVFLKKLKIYTCEKFSFREAVFKAGRLCNIFSASKKLK